MQACRSRRSETLAPQWAQFVARRNEIDASVKKLTNNQQNVKLLRHVGDAWFVSVKTSFAFVDIRNHPTVGQKTDIALHIKELITQVHNDHSTLWCYEPFHLQQSSYILIGRLQHIVSQARVRGCK
jgi:hypothetical protein